MCVLCWGFIASLRGELRDELEGKNEVLKDTTINEKLNSLAVVGQSLNSQAAYEWLWHFQRKWAPILVFIK